MSMCTTRASTMDCEILSYYIHAKMTMSVIINVDKVEEVHWN